MPKSMPTREVIRRLKALGFEFARHGAEHDVYVCGCGQKHPAAVVRHKETTAAVVGLYAKQVPCLKKDWWR